MKTVPSNGSLVAYTVVGRGEPLLGIQGVGVTVAVGNRRSAPCRNGSG
jgi:hypothetical protein